VRLHPDARVAEYRARGAWTNETWNDYLDRAVAARPDHVAIVDPPNRAEITDGEAGRWTWLELSEAVDRLAGVFLAAGLGPDDVVGVQLANTRELAQTYLALSRIGAILSPFPVQFRRHELSILGPAVAMKAIVTSGRIKDRANAQVIEEMSADIPSLAMVLAFGDDIPESAVSLARRLAGDQVEAAQLLARHDETHRPDGNDCVSICWTSGTESVPKGIPRTHDDWLAITWAEVDAIRLTADDVTLSPFPMVNMAGIGGTFLPWLMTGGTLVLHHPFDQELFLQQVATERATFTVAGPALLTKLLQEPELLDATDISSLRVVGSGSSALPAAVVRGWEVDHGVEVSNMYGSNEGVGLVNEARSVPDPAERGILFPRWGRPEVDSSDVPATKWMSSRLIDVETGEEITEPGRPGELRMKGPGVFAGYLASQQLANPFDDDGYCRSGDLFEIAGERNQYYRYVDRHKDIIIRGGFNISAAEVENLVLSHPAVAEAAAVGYPDPVLGERTCVFVVLKDPAGSLSLGELCDYLAAKSVASYKLPERLEIVPSMVRNPLGKVVKEELRKSLR
jgi:acyl-CoA synthetase